MMRKQKNTPSVWLRYGWLVVVVIILAIALRGLATNYLPNIHDITPFIWGKAYFEAVQAGWLYPTWLPQIWYGFGSPVFQFYAPLYYWVVSIFQLVGFDIIYSIKIVLVLSFVGAWGGMYLWSREFLSKFASILSASLFVWAPYYLSLIYLRGAYPEMFALSIMPLLFWSLTRLMKQKSVLHFVISTTIFGTLLLSHTITAGLAMGLAILYILYLYFFEREFQTKPWIVLISIVLAGLLTAFYWLPVLNLVNNINFQLMISDEFAYWNNFPNFNEIVNLLSSQPAGWLTMGTLHLAIVILAIVGYREVLHKIWAKRILATSIVIIALFLMMLPLSDFVWNVLPFIEYLQFPSRLLGPIIIFTALLAGLLIDTFIHSNKNKQLAVIGGLVLMMLVYWPFVDMTPNQVEKNKNLVADDFNIYRYIEKTIHTAHEETKESVYYDQGIFAGEYVSRPLSWKQNRRMISDIVNEANQRYIDDESLIFNKVESLTDAITIETIEEGFVDFEYQINAEEDGQVKINEFEFPSREILLDGKPVNTIIELEIPGQTLDIPAGLHTLTIKFKQLPIVIWSRIFSGIVLLLTIIGLIWFKLRENAGKLKKYGKANKNKKSR